MKKWIGKLIVWGLAATVLAVLLGGCATREIKNDPLYVDPSDESTVALLPGVGVTGYVCDTRWGKCEKHGEWLVPVALIKLYYKHSVRPAMRARGLRLICPGPPVHYIEREIKGPKL